MGPDQPPGSLGSYSLLIDGGTLCRNASPTPSRFALPALSRSDDLQVRQALWSFAVREAFRRGAREYHLSELLFRFARWSQRLSGAHAGSSCPLFQGLDQLESDWAKWLVESERRNFEALIAGELDRISHLIGKVIADADAYRYQVRPLYYSHGYTDPASFLEKIKPYQFLRKFGVWIHEDLGRVFDGAIPVLAKWGSDLVENTTREIRSVNGIQIRTIAHSEALSNHAFGLAVDIDAYSNPHVVGRDVVAVFNWVVAQGGVPFDFGKAILSKEERGHDGYTADDVMEVLNRALNASDAIRDWLKAHLPQYQRLIERVVAAEAVLGISKTPSTTSLEQRVRAAENALNKMARARDAKSTANVCEPLPVGAPESEALRTIQTAAGAIASDENLRRIQILYELTADTKYIAAWSKKGVLTIPLYLAVALVAELGLRWGEQYETSKDAMHFELVGKGGGSYLLPDAPLGRHEKPRTLARLMEQSFNMIGAKPTLEKPWLLSQVAGRR